MKTAVTTILRNALYVACMFALSFCTKPRPEQGRSTDESNQPVNFKRDSVQVDNDSTETPADSMRR